MKRLAIVATHPVQYYVPIYRELSGRGAVKTKVFYGKIPNAENQGAQFGLSFQWDVDLTSGYDSANGKEGVAELMDDIAKRRWDAILIQGWHTWLYLRVMIECLRFGMPVMVRGDSHLYTKRSMVKKMIKYPVYRYFLNKMDACLYVGTWSKEYYRYYGVPDHRLFSSPHCVDQERMDSTSQRLNQGRESIRREFGFSTEDVVFLFVGRMCKMKCVSDMLKALQLAQGKNRAITALMVGVGAEWNALKKESELLGIRLRWHGFMNQSEIVKAYLASDMLVLPSNAEETWGVVVNEAMAMGMPCLLSDEVGCGIDVIQQGVNGWIYTRGDIGQMAQYMVEYAVKVQNKKPFAPSLVLKKAMDYTSVKSANGIIHALDFITHKK